MVDVIYDHFLAADEAEFTEESLDLFAQGVYQVLHQHQTHLPERFAGMLPYMRDQNWLFHYRFKPGIEKSFGGLVRRAAYIDESETAYQLFEDNYQLLQDCFRQFWPELRAFTLEIFKTGVKGI